MNAFEHAVAKIEKAKNDAVSSSWESVSGYDVFHWLSGYIGALKDNELIDDNEFTILREKLRDMPIHESSPSVKAELTQKFKENSMSKVGKAVLLSNFLLIFGAVLASAGLWGLFAVNSVYDSDKIRDWNFWESTAVFVLLFISGVYVSYRGLQVYKR